MATGTAPQVNDWQDTSAVSDWQDTSSHKLRPSEEAQHMLPNPGAPAILGHILSMPVSGLMNAPKEVWDWVKRAGVHDKEHPLSGGFMSDEPITQMVSNSMAAVMPIDKAVTPLETRLSEVAGKPVGTGRVGPNLNPPPPPEPSPASAATAVGRTTAGPALSPWARFVMRRIPGGKIATDAYEAWQEGKAQTSKIVQPPSTGIPQSFVHQPPEPISQPAMAYKVQGPPTPVKPPAPKVVAPPAVNIPQQPAEPAATGPVAAPPIRGWRSAPDAEPTNTVTSPETANPSMPVDRSGVNNLVHGLGQKLGMDHELLSTIAKKRYGVRSMQDMSHEQMVDFYGEMLKGKAAPAGQPLPLKSTGGPSETTLEDQLMRSIEQSAKRAKKTAGPAENPPDDITAYAKGGVIKEKHYLVHARTGKVDGMMSEAGPEKIVPLKQDPADVEPVDKQAVSGQDVIRGSSDIPLSKHGLGQADELGQHFKRAGFGRK